jgi:23S rRNA (uracil1939-C5)-methyltransferase
MQKNKLIVGKIEEVKFPNKSTIVSNGKQLKSKGGILGQTVEAKISRRSKGNITKVIERSELEDESNCIHFDECGGCSYQTMSYEKELSYKKMLLKELYKEINVEDFEIVKSPTYKEYRNKMEYTFSDEYIDGPLTLGMHKRSKFYETVNTDTCNIVDDDFNKIHIFTRKYFDGRVKHYHRKTHKGKLRHLLIRRNLKGEMLVNLVTSSEEYDYSEYFEELKELDIKGKIVGIIHTINDALSDSIVPEQVKIYYGQDYLIEEILGLKFKISLYSFFQTNTKSAEVLYKEAGEMLGKIDGLRLLDLYSGTGTITQILGRSAKEAVGIEIVEEAVEAARENAKINKLDNVKFICGDVFKEVKNLDFKPDIIVLDPPREGINPRAIEDIINFDAEKYLYISCNPVTQVRDIKEFMKKGYKIEKIKMVDQFPRTYHVETVALLSHQEVEKTIYIEYEPKGNELIPYKDATYEEIKTWIKKTYGFNVTNLYIGQAKEKFGLAKRKNYNLSKKEDQVVPKCPEEKMEAIKEAFIHFKMLDGWRKK